MKKILFAISSLSVGGNERIFTNVVNALKDDYNITVLTIYGGGEFAKEIDKKIKKITIFKGDKHTYPKVFRHLNKAALVLFKNYIYGPLKGKYDAYVAFEEGMVTYLLGKKNVNNIAWYQTNIDVSSNQSIKGFLRRIYYNYIYKRYDQIVFNNSKNLQKFKSLYNISSNKVLIGNYLDEKNIISKANEFVPKEIDPSVVSFVTVAKIEADKNPIRLVKIHAKLIKEGYYHKFYYLGDGPLKNQVCSLINELRLNETFQIIKVKDNPYPYMLNGTYYTLLSDFEDSPITVEEAAVLNKNIILTNTLAAEIIKDYPNKRITGNNEEDIYYALKSAIIKGNNQVDIKQNDSSHILNQIRKILPKN